MLTIPADLARAFDTETLARWKTEIAASLRHHYPQAQAFTDAALQDWVRAAMETIRRAGGTSRSDMAIYAHALFRATEAATDPDDAADLIAIMTQPGDADLRLKTLRKAFPLP